MSSYVYSLRPVKRFKISVDCLVILILGAKKLAMDDYNVVVTFVIYRAHMSTIRSYVYTLRHVKRFKISSSCFNSFDIKCEEIGNA